MKNHKHGHAAVPRTRHSNRISDRTSGQRRIAWRSLLVSVAAGLAISTAACLPGFTGAAMAQRMIQVGATNRTASVVVPVGKSDDVRTDQPFVDIMVGNPDIADVNALTDHTLSILGKKIGTTRVSIYGADKKLIGVFDVEVSYDTSALAAELSRRFPRNHLRVSTVNGRILLTGTATDGVALDEVIQIAKQFGPEIINSVQVMQPQQVMLEVRFVEATREADRELGVQWGINAQTTKNSTVTAAIGTAGIIGTATPAFGTIAANVLANGLQVNATISALEQRGLARRLAEPNLVALSGETASFLAGGEYPIPVPGQSLGQIVIEYKQYGVSLAFTPTVLNGNLINLKIIPEVSQLDPSNAVSVGGGAVVPALTVRRATTTLELRDGQSFVLGGLLQNNLSTTQQQLPWVGDVPILGTLFSSKAYQKQETDLIIIVTPHLVQPTRPGDTIRTPLDSALPANDADYFFLKQHPEVLRTEVRGGGAKVERGPIGHMLELPKGAYDAAAR